MDIEPQINRHESPVEEPSYVPSEEEVDRFLQPTSPPYDPEQVVRDHQVLRPLPVPPSSPPAVSPSPPILEGDATQPIVVDEASPQSPALPFATDSEWPADAADSENVWPNPPSLPPTTPTDPATRLCWKCGHAGHLVVGCPIMGVRQRTDITAHGFLRDYDKHRVEVRRLRLQMDRVAKEYGYHKQAMEHMIDTANWTGYPNRVIPTFDEKHPRKPPAVIGSRIKRQRLV